MNDRLIQKLKKIKLIISDVDGVLTDGSIYIGSNGEEMKKFSVEDGTGVALARASGLIIALLSGRFSSATDIRAKELKIEDIYNGMLNKIPAYEELKRKYNLEDSEIVYIGDGLIDIPVMEKAGIPVSVKNAHLTAKETAVYVTDKSGGNGALQETIELVLKAQNQYDDAINKMREKVLNL